MPIILEIGKHQVIREVKYTAQGLTQLHQKHKG